jgi:hypothetical protein
MIDETAFQTALDELAAFLWPANNQPAITPDGLDRFAGTCAVFADWLEDHGDWRATGYRWLSRHRKLPRRCYTWDWWRFGDENSAAPENLPAEVWDRLPGKPHHAAPNCKAYETRRAAEWALCKAILSLEPDT